MKGITRRGAMGSTLGGVLAGPEIAKEAIRETAQTLGRISTPKTNYVGETADSGERIKSAYHAEYIKSETNRLLKLINGEFTEWQQQQLDDFFTNKGEVEIQSLHSVSATYKQLMLMEIVKERMRKEFKRNAIRELKSLVGVDKLNDLLR